jgi:hypothetical protein
MSRSRKTKPRDFRANVNNHRMGGTRRKKSETLGINSFQKPVTVAICDARTGMRMG